MKNPLRPVGRPITVNPVDSNFTLIGERNITMHIALKEKQWIGLSKIALEHKCFHGDRVSISKLLRGIADGYFTVVQTDRLIIEEELAVLVRHPVDHGRVESTERPDVKPARPRKSPPLEAFPQDPGQPDVGDPEPGFQDPGNWSEEPP